MMGFTADGGRKLGVTPTVLVVPPTLEEAGLNILNTEYGAAGASNPWKGTAKLIVTPYL
jgi:phage major head subunit gpT-like protein